MKLGSSGSVFIVLRIPLPVCAVVVGTAAGNASFAALPTDLNAAALPTSLCCTPNSITSACLLTAPKSISGKNFLNLVFKSINSSASFVFPFALDVAASVSTIWPSPNKSTKSFNLKSGGPILKPFSVLVRSLTPSFRNSTLWPLAMALSTCGPCSVIALASFLNACPCKVSTCADCSNGNCIFVVPL